MDRGKIIRSLRINYIVSIVAALAVVLAFELGFIEKGAMVNVVSADTMYMIQVTAVMLTIALIPLAIKGFTRAMEKVKGNPEEVVVALFCKKSLQRIFLLFLVVVINEFVYYGLGYDSSLYCCLIGLGSMIYSFPTKMVLEQSLGERE